MNEPESLFDVKWMSGHWYCGRTKVFHIIKKHKIKTVRVGRKTLAPGSEIRRVDAECLRDPDQASYANRKTVTPQTEKKPGEEARRNGMNRTGVESAIDNGGTPCQHQL